MQYGLDDNTLNRILQVFAAQPQVQEVILYGSRAKGTFRPGSDIDLTIFGNNLSLPVINNIANLLDDLDLPYKFDLSVFNKIDNPDLVDHIKRVGCTLYRRAS